MADRLFLSTGTDAVDASLVTKDHALRTFAATEHVPLSRIAAIGDSVNDLPFLTLSGLGLRGIPSNAQPAVRSGLGDFDNKIELQTSFTEAFLEFYAIAGNCGIQYVFADKDGVLVWRDTDAIEHGPSLRTIFSNAGLGTRPFVFVLTGSSYEANIAFLRSFDLAAACEGNPRIRERPFCNLSRERRSSN